MDYRHEHTMSSGPVYRPESQGHMSTLEDKNDSAYSRDIRDMRSHSRFPGSEVSLGTILTGRVGD